MVRTGGEKLIVATGVVCELYRRNVGREEITSWPLRRRIARPRRDDGIEVERVRVQARVEHVNRDVIRLAVGRIARAPH